MLLSGREKTADMKKSVFNTMLSGTVLFFLACGPLAAAETKKREQKLLIPVQAIAAGCDGFLQRNEVGKIRECAASETGVFGHVGEQILHYVLYCIIPDHASATAKCSDSSFQRRRGLAVFVQETAQATQAQLLMEYVAPEIETSYTYKPLLATNSFGTLMHVPIAIDGTGNYNESEYYIWKKQSKAWKLLDSEKWLDELLKRLPPGLAIWKGIWPDLETMTAEAGLYRKDDGNCCPTGGTAFIKLAVKEDRIILQSVKFEKGEEQ
jgi:hypothetical protein